MIPVRSVNALEQLRPDVAAIRALHAADGDWFSLHIFAPQAYDSSNVAHARHYLPAETMFEDPVTGSATGGMGCYLLRYGLVNRLTFTIEQGHIMGRPGLVDVEIDGTPDAITGVRIAGPAVTVITGELRL